MEMYSCLVVVSFDSCKEILGILFLLPRSLESLITVKYVLPFFNSKIYLFATDWMCVYLKFLYC
jgi:hypothetical protein